MLARATRPQDIPPRSVTSTGDAAPHPMIVPRQFQSTTHDVRITVRPVFSPEHSDPVRSSWVFVYFIRIENLGDRTIELLTRHWLIHDEAAGDSVVDGEGVVGEQPVIAPGDCHEYDSFCVLNGPEGHMVGSYRFRRTDGIEFDADIPRFPLSAEGATDA